MVYMYMGAMELRCAMANEQPTVQGVKELSNHAAAGRRRLKQQRDDCATSFCCMLILRRHHRLQNCILLIINQSLITDSNAIVVAPFYSILHRDVMCLCLLFI